MNHTETVITVQNLHKRYGDHIAVEDISFEVKRGEIFGIIGPNGAGKTTTVESIIGLRQPDGGRIQLLGRDPQANSQAISQRIGIQLQQANIPDRMKVWEALDTFASFYEHTIPWEPLLEQWGLTEKRDTYFDKLSGGQKQRLFIALALLNDPEIVFLDELTTGLDPQARRATWKLVEAIRDQGKTVVLVTHFMDEAQVLCDRMAIIDHGRVVALDTPQALIDSISNETRVIFAAPQTFDPTSLHHVDGVTNVAQENGHIITHGRGPLLVNIILALHEHGITPTDIRTEQPDLEDVFIALTGHNIRD
ncbi:MAG: ABC transporter ATP-binding protein [Anaerolineales bacterium]|nr:ABC transporter ATP-binding protein [Anaerolineales bacterium]